MPSLKIKLVRKFVSRAPRPSQRIAAVYTSIENFPFTDERMEFYSWIPEFCKVCNRCVEECPAQAIYPESISLEDGKVVHIDYRKCAEVFSKTLGCGVCIKECPFFKSDFFRIRKAYEKIAEKERVRLKPTTLPPQRVS